MASFDVETIDREPRQLNVRLAPVGDVDQEIDGPDDLARLVGQQAGPGLEPHPPPVRPLGNGFDAADRPSLPQRHRHWAVFKGHGSAVRVIEPPGAAPFGAKFRAVAPQGRRRFIVEDDVTLGVGHVDRHRQHLEQGRPRNCIDCRHDLRS